MNQRIEAIADWRAVSCNTPSRNMPRSVPWVHGLILDWPGISPRIELAPKRQGTDHFPVQLVLVHPDQDAAALLPWDAEIEITVDGHAVRVQKSIGPADGWCPELAPAGGVFALVAEIDADHPLVVHASAAAKALQEDMDRATDAFYAHAREWCDRNFPHPDFMNVVRALVWEQWNGRADYWPGDPLPDADAVVRTARERILAR